MHETRRDKVGWEFPDGSSDLPAVPQVSGQPEAPIPQTCTGSRSQQGDLAVARAFPTRSFVLWNKETQNTE